MNYTSLYLNDLAIARSSIPNLDRINGKKVIITGATGLVCSAIVDFLLYYNELNDSGVTVYVSSRDKDKAKKRFERFLNRKDLFFIDYDSQKKIDWALDVDYIIHGASPANPALYATQPVETMLVNIIGLNNILEYSRTHVNNRVLFVSSSEVYGKKDDKEPYGDDEYGFVDILNPRACYPSAKRACETLCAAYRSEYGVDSVITRLGHVYGPTASRSDTRASSQFFYDVLDGHNIVMKSSGMQLRSYCYVVDCVSSILTVLLNGESCMAYNVSNPASIVTIRDLASCIAHFSGKEVVFENPSDLEKRGYNLMDNSSLESRKIEMLGWKGLFDINEGVRHTLLIMEDNN